MGIQNKNAPVNTFENVYQTYSSALYGIACELLPSKEKADDLFVQTFQKFHVKQLVHQNSHCIYISLVKLMIQTFLKKFNSGNLKIKPFEKYPVLHKLICENIELEEYCREYNITRAQGSKNIRKEINEFRK